MRDKPFLSVIMTVYNGERFLTEAIDSILNQSFADFELIVVDDASHDRTAQLLRDYTDARLQVITNKTNIGPYRAANCGLKVARGTLIARHDADDVSLPQRFEVQVARMQAQPELTLLGTSYKVIDAQGTVLDTSILPADNAQILERLTKGNVFLHGTFMMRRDALEAVDYYREHFPVSQDYDLSLRLAELGEVAILPEPLYLFRFHRSSISRNKRELQLSCRQFAWAQAVARRAGQLEQDVPEDVLAAYPPERERLLFDALGTAYLFYAARQFALADEMLTQAQEFASNLPAVTVDWHDWLLQRARKLAELHDDTKEGEAFLLWALRRIRQEIIRLNSREIRANFYAERAFRAHQDGSPRHVMQDAWRTVRTHPVWLRNKGLWSITMQALRAMP